MNLFKTKTNTSKRKLRKLYINYVKAFMQTGIEEQSARLMAQSAIKEYYI